MEDVIKSYLVALGFSVDNASFNKMQDTLKTLGKTVSEKTSSMTRDYAAASAAIVTSLSSVAFATADLLDKVAQADLGYQKFAMRMYMAKDAAKELKIVTEAMGESMHDIAWMPELNQRYQKLMGEARGMETPKDAAAQLRYIRDIRFEFTRLKVEATYGLQWIGYSLFKYLGVPIKDLHDGFSKINDWIQGHMPEWTNKIAEWVAMFLQLGKDGGAVLAAIGDGWKKLWDMLNPTGKTFAVGAGITALFAASGPFGQALIMISLVTLAMNDFFAYLDGRNSTVTVPAGLLTLVHYLDKIVALVGLISDIWDADIFSRRGTSPQAKQKIKTAIANYRAYSDDDVWARSLMSQHDKNVMGNTSSTGSSENILYNNMKAGILKAEGVWGNQAYPDPYAARGGKGGVMIGPYQFDPATYSAVAKKIGVSPTDYSGATQEKIAQWNIMDTLKRNQFRLDPSLAEWNGGIAGKQAYLAGRPWGETSTYLRNAHSVVGGETTVNVNTTVNGANQTPESIGQIIADKVSATMKSLKARESAGFVLQGGVNP